MSKHTDRRGFLRYGAIGGAMGMAARAVGMGRRRRRRSPSKRPRGP